MASYVVRDQGVVVHGFAALQRALNSVQSRADYGLAYELQRRLRTIGEKVAESAPEFVTHYSGHTGPYPGEPDNPRLEDSVRVSVTTRSASVYSTAMHGGAQNVGGQVGRKRHTILERAKVSKWMNKAVSSNYIFVDKEVDGLLDWLLSEWNTDNDI